MTKKPRKEGLSDVFTHELLKQEKPHIKLMEGIQAQITEFNALMAFSPATNAFSLTLVEPNNDENVYVINFKVPHKETKNLLFIKPQTNGGKPIFGVLQTHGRLPESEQMSANEVKNHLVNKMLACLTNREKFALAGAFRRIENQPRRLGREPD